MQTVCNGQGRAFINHPLIRPVEYLLPVRKISFAIKTVDPATPGKPFVQNDTRVRDELLTMDVAVQSLCAE